MSAWQFFYGNAEYSWRSDRESEVVGHVRCAIELARAEAWAKSALVGYVWRFDGYEADRRVNTCTLYLPCMACMWPEALTDMNQCPRSGLSHQKAALHGIDLRGSHDERGACKRVVEAQLALEVLQS